eukprot:279001-Rhodomonas_salina.1
MPYPVQTSRMVLGQPMPCPVLTLGLCVDQVWQTEASVWRKFKKRSKPEALVSRQWTLDPGS